MGEEKKTNPFLRPCNKNIRTQIGMLDATDEEVFGKIRAMKDAY
jgi:hydroxyacylglutathione hydrolase